MPQTAWHTFFPVLALSWPGTDKFPLLFPYLLAWLAEGTHSTEYSALTCFQEWEVGHSEILEAENTKQPPLSVIFLPDVWYLATLQPCPTYTEGAIKNHEFIFSGESPPYSGIFFISLKSLVCDLLLHFSKWNNTLYTTFVGGKLWRKSREYFLLLPNKLPPN